MTDTYLSDYLEKAILNHVLRHSAYTPAATVYCRLATSTATQAELHAGTLTHECTGGSYTGKAIAFNAPATGGYGRKITSNGAVDFTNMPACTVRYAFISDAATAGNVLAVCQLASDVVVAAGETLHIADTALVIELDDNSATLAENGSQMSTYLQDKILNLVFRNTAYTSPTTVYAGIASSTATGTELEAGTLTHEITTYNESVRPTVTFSAPNSDTYLCMCSAAVDAVYTVMSACTVLWAFISDSATKGAGNILWWLRTGNPVTWTSADEVGVSAGATLNLTADPGNGGGLNVVQS